ncbi:MAG: hypothetical protein MK096_02580 [Oleiphilaceae bacterium]|nr:hypothetical protein [Oleiphilaceae bacterium]
MKRVVVVFLAFSSLVVSDVHAARGDYPYYGGVELFATSSELVSADDLDNTVAFFVEEEGLGTLENQRRITFEDAGHGKRIYMGVSPHVDWDWEWGYIDFGKTHGGYQGDSSSTSLDMRMDVKSEGWFLHVQYSPQIADKWEANIKLGVLRWDGERYSRLVTENNLPFEKFETVAGIDQYYGVGVMYELNERWKLRGDINRYTFGDDLIDTVGITAQFWFSGRLINNIFDY